MVFVKAVEVAEVSKTAILGVSSDKYVLINAPSQAAGGSQTSSSDGEMNFIAQGSHYTAQSREIPHGGFRPALFSARDANSHGTEFHVLQMFLKKPRRWI